MTGKKLQAFHYVIIARQVAFCDALKTSCDRDFATPTLAIRSPISSGPLRGRQCKKALSSSLALQGNGIEDKLQEVNAVLPNHRPCDRAPTEKKNNKMCMANVWRAGRMNNLFPDRKQSLTDKLNCFAGRIGFHNFQPLCTFSRKCPLFPEKLLGHDRGRGDSMEKVKWNWQSLFCWSLMYLIVVTVPKPPPPSQ